MTSLDGEIELYLTQFGGGDSHWWKINKAILSDGNNPGVLN